MTERPRFSRLKTFASKRNNAIPNQSAPAPQCEHQKTSITQNTPGCLGGRGDGDRQRGRKIRAGGKRLNGEVIHCFATSPRQRGLIAPLEPPLQGRAALKIPAQWLPPLEPAFRDVAVPDTLAIRPAVVTRRAGRLTCSPACHCLPSQKIILCCHEIGGDHLF
jgi:hypothetical protein